MSPQFELLKSRLEILGLSLGSTFEEIKGAYRTQLKRWHPDLHMHSPEARQRAEEITRLINAAFDWLDRNQEFLKSGNASPHPTRNWTTVSEKYRFSGSLCEEIDQKSPLDLLRDVKPELIDCRLGRTISESKMFAMMDQLAKLRNYTYQWVDSFPDDSTVRARVDFTNRNIQINLSLCPRFKSVLVAGAQIFFRDWYHFGRERERGYFLETLRASGWTGTALFSSASYYESEIEICNEVANCFVLSDAATRAENISQIAHFWEKCSSHFAPKGWGDRAHHIAQRFRFDAPRSLG